MATRATMTIVRVRMRVRYNRCLVVSTGASILRARSASIEKVVTRTGHARSTCTVTMAMAKVVTTPGSTSVST